RSPQELADRPYLQPVYDDPEFVVRNVWRLYGGWWDGNPASLKPAPEAALAHEIVGLAGADAVADRVDHLLTRADDTALRLAAPRAVAMAAAAMAPTWAGETALSFGAPIKVTPANGGGYEPGIYADRYGDLFMTAHKENAELALSPDSRSATGTRSMSWT